MQFSPEKYEMLLLTNKLHPIISYNTTYAITLVNVKSAKYLGHNIANILSLNHDIENILREASGINAFFVFF